MDKRRRIQGEVISNNNDKTICVALNGYKKHSKYLKRVAFRSKYYAHDEKNEANVGDIVTIEECRPMSRTKRFVLVSIDKKALEQVVVNDEAAVEEVMTKKEEKTEETKEAE